MNGNRGIDPDAQRPDSKDNVALIGMPGAGKSTVGILLAKALGAPFVDTDVLIQTNEGRRLQELLDALGAEGFCAREARHILALQCRGTVIATGGSVVYSDDAMRHLAAHGCIVYLEVPPEILKNRLSDFSSRGVVIPRGTGIETLYAERRSRYTRWADYTVNAAAPHDTVVRRILACLCPKRVEGPTPGCLE